MGRLDKARQVELEPQRMEYAKSEIQKLGYEITKESKTALEFVFKGEKVVLFPYSGWHAGKSITDGRGIEKLLKQIRKW